MSDQTKLSITQASNDTSVPFSILQRQIADATYGMTSEDYSRFLTRAGFEPLAALPTGRETFHIFGHSASGVLLTFDTFHKQKNCASMQFRTSRPIWEEPVDTDIEAMWDIDRKTTHLRMDARSGVLAILSFFEETTGFKQAWGNKGVDPSVCDLTLEQDAAVALREGISPRDMSRRMREVSAKRAEMLPKDWYYRWDFSAQRTQGEANALLR